MPSRHSGSSHSSSSSSFSSSGSSSSSYSNRSSSSFSSNRSYSSSGSSFSRPSSHSSSSRTSSYSGSSRNYDRNRTYNNYSYYKPRTRYNQPVGYYPSWTWLFLPRYRRPRTYYCRNHTYVFYPQSWTDNSGRTYQSGYYDENGQYYKDLALKNYDSLHEVLCECENCGYVINRSLDEDDITTCPKCGSNMKIITNVDEFIAEEEKQKRGNVWKTIGFALIAVVVPVIFIGWLFTSIRNRPTTYYYNTNTQPPVSVVTPSAKESITLKKLDDNRYALDTNSTDKTIVYIADEDSYYDEETGLWLWFNEEYKVWQYWYEPISANYSDYGWMEHDSDGWWIERYAGDWIQVPSHYDTSKLWYIVD